MKAENLNAKDREISFRDREATLARLVSEVRTLRKLVRLEEMKRAGETAGPPPIRHRAQNLLGAAVARPQPACCNEGRASQRHRIDKHVDHPKADPDGSRKPTGNPRNTSNS
jgi:hypothetical protein